MKKNAIGLTVAALAMTGCSSVDQVPLVYVSTAKVGVSVESGSAETPGASIMIGVDLTDAAYVPVAVARRCDQTTMSKITNCVDKEIAIWKVLGTSTDITEDLRQNLLELSESADELRDDLREADRKYFQALEAEKSARDDLAESANAVELVEELTTLSDKQGPEFDRQEELVEAQAIAERLERRQQRVETSAKATRDSRDELTNMVRNFNDLSDAINTLLDREQGTRTDQTDALSVYGRFDGDMGGEAGTENSATVGLGKVFSTGIAAQNLTRGIKEAEASVGMARCLSAAADVYDRLKKDGKNPDMAKFAELCGMKVEND